MTNEELLARINQGDESALAELIAANGGLIHARAARIARQFNCLRPSGYGGWSDYTEETLSELESVGTLALIECVRGGGYDGAKGSFTTYAVPFLDGAMRRHMESSMGTLSLDRDSMALVRRAQRLYHREGKELSGIAEALGISVREAARAVGYPTHFLSVYDLTGPEAEGDPYDSLPISGAGGSAEEEVLRSVTMDCLREEFLALSKRDQDILGRCFGVFGYEKCGLREIAIRDRLREDGVEKAKNRALERLRERCLNSLGWKLRRARAMVDRAKAEAE